MCYAHDPLQQWLHQHTSAFLALRSSPPAAVNHLPAALVSLAQLQPRAMVKQRNDMLHDQCGQVSHAVDLHLLLPCAIRA
jgi:hypothetical protein